MLNVIAVDNDAKALAKIKSAADWDALGMKFCGGGKNADEALALIKEQKAAIVIMEIKSPHFDGFDFAERARELKPNLEFIIVSGRKSFDCARRAVGLDFAGYLTRPLNKKDFALVLENAKARVKAKRKKAASRASASAQTAELTAASTATFTATSALNSPASSARTSAALTKEQLRRKFFDFLENGTNIDAEKLTLGQINETFGYHFEKGIFRYGIFKIDGNASEIYTEQLAACYDKICGLLPFALAPHSSDVEIKPLVSGAAFVFAYTQKEKNKVLHALKSVFDEMRSHNYYFPAATFTIALGGEGKNIGELFLSKEEAEWQIAERLFLGANALYEKMQRRENWSDLLVFTNALVQKLERLVDIFDKDAAGKAFDETAEELLANKFVTGHDILHFAKAVYSDWQRIAARFGEEKTNEDFYEKLDVLSTPQQVLQHLKSTISASFLGITERYASAHVRPVTRAKKYVQENYSEHISLAEFAAKEGFNSSYLSTLFKKETGRNFSEYLIETRMNAAAKLLKETNFSLTQISESVGYANLKYFSETFKKIIGVQPSAYRKLHALG